VHGENDAERNASREDERERLPPDLFAYNQEIGILDRRPKGAPYSLEREAT
jgi:hypothetical protein